MSLGPDFNLARPLSDKVLILLRPELTGVVTRPALPPVQCVLIVIALALLVWSIIQGWGFFIAVPAAGVVFHTIGIAVHISDNRNLKTPDPSTTKQAEIEKARQEWEQLNRTSNLELRKALAPLDEIAPVPGHRVEALRKDDNLVIVFATNSGDRILESDLGTTASINLKEDASKAAEGIIHTAQDMTAFYLATDAFTRPPRLPGIQQRMKVEPVDAEHYEVDGQTVSSPGHERIAMDVAIACWQPWHKRLTDLRDEQRLDQQMREQWLAGSELEDLGQAQTRAEDDLVARRRAYLERIKKED